MLVPEAAVGMAVPGRPASNEYAVVRLSGGESLRLGGGGGGLAIGAVELSNGA